MQVQRGLVFELFIHISIFTHWMKWNRFFFSFMQGFTGSGTTCRPLESCVDNESICHANALCAWNTEGYYGCRCREGFRGDGYQCQGKIGFRSSLIYASLRTMFCFIFDFQLFLFLVIPKHEGKFLLISHGMSILRVPIHSSPSTPGRPIFIQIFQAAVGNKHNLKKPIFIESN
jgi:nidogen (entactin)